MLADRNGTGARPNWTVLDPPTCGGRYYPTLGFRPSRIEARPAYPLRAQQCPFAEVAADDGTVANCSTPSAYLKGWQNVFGGLAVKG